MSIDSFVQDCNPKRLLPKAEQELRFEIRKDGRIDPDYLRTVPVKVNDCGQCPYGFIHEKTVYCTMEYRTD